MPTENLNLETVQQSQKVVDLLSAFNGNMESLDELPLPVEAGSNSQLSYLKFANGMLAMWGIVDHGTRYPFDQSWGTASDNYHGFHSDDWWVNYPVPLVDSDPVIFATAEDSWYSQVFVVKRGEWTTERACFAYWSTLHYGADATFPGESTRRAHLLILGRWK